MRFEQIVEMACRFKVQLVGDFRQRHLRVGKQLLGILQFGFVYVLRDGAVHIFFKNTCKLRIAVRHF